MERIALVSPHREFGKVALEVAQEMNIVLDYYNCDLDGIDKLLISMESSPPDVILSRGGLGILLKKKAKIPVSVVPVGILDILQCCSEAKEYDSHIGVTSFEKPLIGIEEIEKVLGVSITPIIFTTQKQLKEQIAFLSQETKCCIVGGGPSVKYAEEYGLPSVYLTSNPVTIKDALLQAQELAELHQEIKKQNSRLKAILDSIYDGVVAVDQYGKIELVNQSAEKIFSLTGRDWEGKFIHDILPSSCLGEVLQDGISQIGVIQKEGRVRIVTNRVPVRLKNELIGAVATFQEAERIARVEQKVRHSLLADHNFSARFYFSDIISVSKVMEEKKLLAQRFAGSDHTVLIYGESGTGKELFAQSIHHSSNRKKQPFVAVNCGALPASLLESELFGYEEGAFTGAKRKGRYGLFELAHQGTLFLDEIDSLSLEFQGRLLRVLQEGEFMRIGGERMIPVDVRIITATNSNPVTLLAEKRMREDLYYRLNVLYLELPPLRKRKEDVAPMIEQWLQKAKSPFLKGPLSKMQPWLENYSWPGNVRELHNILERVSLYLGDFAEKDYPPEKIFEMIAPQILVERDNQEVLQKEYQADLKKNEQEWIERALVEKGTLEKAAKSLGMSRSTLWRKLRSFKNEQMVSKMTRFEDGES